jgi:hypothetical protein
MEQDNESVVTSQSDPLLEFAPDPLTHVGLDAFLRATETLYCQTIPLTIYTLYRRSEFLWLERIRVDLRKLLHTEQEYEFLRPMVIGESLLVKTKLADKKIRSSLGFYTLSSEIFGGDDNLISKSRSMFVVRS